MSDVLVAEDLGKRYGQNWALRHCSFGIAPGRVTALVGSNGAGKSTLLELAIGLLSPNEGSISVLGSSPTSDAAKVLPRVGFVAQEHPLYRGFTVDEMLRLGRHLNPRWDDAFARGRIQKLGLPMGKKVGHLSGGQRAQVALVLALAKRPELLLLDEPISGFDPLARREFLTTLMEMVAETGSAVLLSSHILGDLERVCDSLMLISAGRLQVFDHVDHLLASHRMVIGPVGERRLASCAHHVVSSSQTEKQVATLLRLEGPLVLSDAWSAYEPSLEDIVLGYLSGGAGDSVDVDTQSADSPRDRVGEPV